MILMAISRSIKETEKFAQEFLENTKSNNLSATIAGLKGDLGSGKTAFTKAVAKHLGVELTVTSPTFVIEKIYKLEGQKYEHLVHIDAYRLEGSGELETLGFKKLLTDLGNLILIEWPENVLEILPENIRTINFKFVDETTREINFDA